MLALCCGSQEETLTLCGTAGQAAQPHHSRLALDRGPAWFQLLWYPHEACWNPGCWLLLPGSGVTAAKVRRKALG